MHSLNLFHDGSEREAFGSNGGRDMKDKKQERWLELCRQAASEQDPARLLELLQEINKLLEERKRKETPSDPQACAYRV